MGIFKGIKKADVKRAKEVIFSECWRNFDSYVSIDVNKANEAEKVKTQDCFASFKILYNIICELNWEYDYERWKKRNDLSW